MKIYFLRVTKSENVNFRVGEFLFTDTDNMGDDYSHSGQLWSGAMFIIDGPDLMVNLKSILSHPDFQGISVELVEFQLTGTTL